MNRDVRRWPQGLAIVVLVLAASVWLQSRTTQFRSSTDVVEVYATVRTSQGVFARDLRSEDFELLDNGRRRDIAVFSSDVQPTAIGVLLDRSGSVQPQWAQIATAASTFLAKLLPDDRASLGSLTWDCQPLTSNKDRLQTTLQGPLPVDRGSPIWGATSRILSSLSPEGGRRAVLLFSDGDDLPQLMPATFGPHGVAPTMAIQEMSRESGCEYRTDPSLATLDDVVNRASREGVLVYSVSVDNDARSTKDANLRRVAHESGGERYRLRDFGELSDAFERIADELHHQYLLGFVPVAFDGKRHDIEVRVKQPGVTVRARKSYVAVKVSGANPDTTTAPASTRTATVAPITEADVGWAIGQGTAGRSLQASCTATGTFDRAEENNVVVQITVEGPLGRIMRAAREARARRATLDGTAVTAEMRAPLVDVTAEFKERAAVAGTAAPDPAISAPPPTAVGALPTIPKGNDTAGPRQLVTMRVRSREIITAWIEPIAEPSGVPASPSAGRLLQRFDLSAFRSLPGPDIEVVAHSTAGARRCTLPAKDTGAIR